MCVEIACLGEAMVEFNQKADGVYHSGYGGDTSNCAIAAARQGAKVGYITRIGSDFFGDCLHDLWQKERIDLTGVKRCKQDFTGIYFVTHDQKGHHFSYYRKGSAASHMELDDLPATILAQTKILHVSGISQAISPSACDVVFAAINQVKAAGGMVAYDPNLRLKLWPLARARAVIHGAMAQCDIALPAFADAVLLTGCKNSEAIVDFYLALGAKIVALSLGEAGSLVATPETRQKIPAKKANVIDATAAGDIFDGAFLAELVAGKDPFSAGRYANIAASLSTEIYGSVAAIPYRNQVERILAGDLHDTSSLLAERS